jgi:hypothetical protein
LLAWAKRHLSEETIRNYVWHGQSFSEHSGYLLSSALKPIHVTRWADTHGWGPTSERNARRSVHRVFLGLRRGHSRRESAEGHEVPEGTHPPANHDAGGIRQNWLTADMAAKRRYLEILVLNFSVVDVTLVPVWRKPFNMLAEGLPVQSSRGDKI